MAREPGTQSAMGEEDKVMITKPINRTVFRPYPVKHLKLDPSWMTMDSRLISKRRKKLNSKMFPSEIWFERLLKKNGIYGFRRNVPILSRFFGDFVFRNLGLVIEIDGKSHTGKKEYDSKRDEFINKFGITVLRIAFGDLERANEIIEIIKFNKKEYDDKRNIRDQFA